MLTTQEYRSWLVDVCGHRFWGCPPSPAALKLLAKFLHCWGNWATLRPQKGKTYFISNCPPRGSVLPPKQGFTDRSIGPKKDAGVAGLVHLARSQGLSPLLYGSGHRALEFRSPAWFHQPAPSSPIPGDESIDPGSAFLCKCLLH